MSLVSNLTFHNLVPGLNRTQSFYQRLGRKHQYLQVNVSLEVTPEKAQVMIRAGLDWTSTASGKWCNKETITTLIPILGPPSLKREAAALQVGWTSHKEEHITCQ